VPAVTDEIKEHGHELDDVPVAVEHRVSQLRSELL
jgi:hypothetical protein